MTAEPMHRRVAYLKDLLAKGPGKNMAEAWNNKREYTDGIIDAVKTKGAQVARGGRDRVDELLVKLGQWDDAYSNAIYGDRRAVGGNNTMDSMRDFFGVDRSAFNQMDLSGADKLKIASGIAGRYALPVTGGVLGLQAVGSAFGQGADEPEPGGLNFGNTSAMAAAAALTGYGATQGNQQFDEMMDNLRMTLRKERF